MTFRGELDPERTFHDQETFGKPLEMWPIIFLIEDGDI
jgi:hypothetical protein